MCVRKIIWCNISFDIVDHLSFIIRYQFESNDVRCETLLKKFIISVFCFVVFISILWTVESPVIQFSFDFIAIEMCLHWIWTKKREKKRKLYRKVNYYRAIKWAIIQNQRKERFHPENDKSKYGSPCSRYTKNRYAPPFAQTLASFTYCFGSHRRSRE